ncbi:NAD(P)-dependent alcohol dehydrogenase [Halosimplex amylolyticum]|uniref:NAD(P)-dependent alcohol dehydrogenase n=1 Tax=Halosimplex amylolyticum TaxID=3396616 RepID=UPI003F5635A1
MSQSKRRPESTVGRGYDRAMQAVVQDEYGPPDVLKLRAVEPPVPEDDEVLVRVHAAGANPADSHLMRGDPYFVRLLTGLRAPKNGVPGLDVAGRVEAVGDDVTAFRPGDEVFGEATGSFAEYACAAADELALKPDSLTYVEAAAVPIAGVTALQGLRDEGRLEAGQRILINGASGGVGTFAVQIATSRGAHVAGVCSTRNVDMVRELGADDVFDYTTEDFTLSGERYDVVFDLVGNRSPRALRRALAPGGTLVLSSGAGGPLIGPLGTQARALLASLFADHRVAVFIASVNGTDLAALSDLIESGDVTPVVDRTYPLAEAAEAIRYLERGHARGKVVVTVAGDGE